MLNFSLEQDLHALQQVVGMLTWNDGGPHFGFIVQGVKSIPKQSLPKQHPSMKPTGVVWLEECLLEAVEVWQADSSFAMKSDDLRVSQYKWKSHHFTKRLCST